MKDYSPHQRKIIKRYYENFDSIKLQQLNELAAELFLAAPAKRNRLWQKVEETLTALKLPASRVEHLLAKKEPVLLGELLKELNANA